MLKSLWNKSPQENMQALVKRFRDFSEDPLTLQENRVYPNQEIYPELVDYIAEKYLGCKENILLLGPENTRNMMRKALEKANCKFEESDWASRSSDKNQFCNISHVIVTWLPVSRRQWEDLRSAKAAFECPVVSATALLLAATPLIESQKRLEYYRKNLADALPYFQGKIWHGEIDKLNAIYSLEGKRVIEFGPMDGSQTAGLVCQGVGQVVSIEARAENALKLLAAIQTFDWRNVQLVMDDFHNVDAKAYGKYDLAFANGVYYHSIDPFFFLENLMSLADHIFIGGFCATESLPRGSFEILEHKGYEYRSKKHKEWDIFTGGVNAYAYYLQADDLMIFFEREGYEVQIISREICFEHAGEFVRFFAKKN